MHFNIWTVEISVAFKIIVFFFFYTRMLQIQAQTEGTLHLRVFGD
jgi:hypothetical protein